jgi:hypothetical protein
MLRSMECKKDLVAPASYKELGKSSKMLPQIFANSCEDIISIDKPSSDLQKDGVTDCVEFSSVFDKWWLGQVFFFLRIVF